MAPTRRSVQTLSGENPGVQLGTTVVPRYTSTRTLRLAFWEPAAPVLGEASAFQTSDRLCTPITSRTVMPIAWREVSG
jgi:hypothetical protein